MFNWLFRKKTEVEVKATSKGFDTNTKLGKKEFEEATAKVFVAKIRYVFEHCKQANGDYYNPDEVEQAITALIDTGSALKTAPSGWLRTMLQDELTVFDIGLERKGGLVKYFGLSPRLLFWSWEFTERDKLTVRVNHNFHTGSWQNIYDTESVILRHNFPTSCIDSSAQIPNIEDVALYPVAANYTDIPNDKNVFVEAFQSALEKFISNEVDFKEAIKASVNAWLADASLLLVLNASTQSYETFTEDALVQSPLNFAEDSVHELKCLLENGWDFEWQAANDTVIYLSMSVPDGYSPTEIRNGGIEFIESIVTAPDVNEWIATHLRNRLNTLLGLRIPDSSITHHRDAPVVIACGMFGCRTLTQADLQRIKRNDNTATPIEGWD